MIHKLTLACTLLALAACGKDQSETALINSAKALVEKQETGAAVIELKDLLSRYPESGEARLLLGKALLQVGDSANAEIELGKAQASSLREDQVVPEIARALLMAGKGARLIALYGDKSFPSPVATADLKSTLAMAYMAEGDLERAGGVTAEALQLQPGYGPAVILQARMLATDGNTAKALQLLDELVQREPGNPSAGLLKAEILLRGMNDPAAAIEAYRKVRTSFPRTITAHTGVINILVQQNKATEARADFEQLKKLAPKHPDTLFLQAQFAFEDKNFKASRELCETLLVAMPNNLRVLLLAGGAEYRMGQYLLAEGLFGRALKIAPNLRSVRHMLARTYLRSNHPEKALDVLEPLIGPRQADAPSLALAGEAYLERGDPKRSQAAFQRALSIEPGLSSARTSMAVAQSWQGDGALAQKQLEAIAGGESGSQADLALVSVRLRQNDLQGTLKAIDALQKKLPDQAFPLALRGRVLAESGDAAGAKASLEQALSKDPGYFAALASLAAIDFDAGRPDLARKRFDDQIKSNPKNFRAVLALAELETRLGTPVATVVGTLRQAVKADPSQPATHLALIERLLSIGDNQGAEVAAQEAAAALPTDLRVLAILGRTQVAAGDSQRAISTFKRLSAMEPRNPAHAVLLADAHRAGNDPGQAAAAFRQALEIQIDHLPAQRGLALLAANDKRVQEGVAIARSIQERQPKDPTGYALEGEVMAHARNWSAAASAYTAALQRAESTELAIHLHRSLSEGGKAADAERWAADWMKRHPKDLDFAFHLGDMALAAKDWSKAESRYRAVLSLQPRQAAAMNNIAWAMVMQRKAGATAMAEQANKLQPDRAPFLDTLSQALEADDQLAKALDAQKRAVELGPNDPSLRLRLAQLYVKRGNKADAREQLDLLSRHGKSFPGHAEAAALLKSL